MSGEDGQKQFRETHRTALELVDETVRLRAALAQRDTTIAAARQLLRMLDAWGYRNHVPRKLRAALSAPVEAGGPVRRAESCTCSGTENPPVPAEMDPACPLHGVTDEVPGEVGGPKAGEGTIQWLTAEFARAHKRFASLPRGSRPVIVAPAEPAGDTEPPTFDEYESLVRRAHAAHPQWRLGQTYVNVAHTFLPDLLAMTEEGPHDCFYRDDMIPDFLARLHALARLRALAGSGPSQPATTEETNRGC